MNKNIDVIVEDVDILVSSASNIIDNTYKKINMELIIMYWNIGKLVNDYRKEHNSKYGDSVILKFSEELSKKYGSGFSRKNINRMNLFNKKFEIGSAWTQSSKDSNKELKIVHARGQSQIGNNSNNKIKIEQSTVQSISWRHYVELLNINDNSEIKYYLEEISNNKWSIKYLIEQKRNKAYQRLICNQKEDSIFPIEKSLKDPLILPINKVSSEKELEKDIILNVKTFMKELGNGYSFIGNQEKIIINKVTYRIDLVFYNKILRCYVLVDLKIGKVKRSDIAQMDMYINYYNKHELDEFDNKTIGIILTTSKNVDITSYLNSDDNIYQVKYVTKMPDISELETIINENIIILLKR